MLILSCPRNLSLRVVSNLCHFVMLSVRVNPCVFWCLATRQNENMRRDVLIPFPSICFQLVLSWFPPKRTFGKTLSGCLILNSFSLSVSAASFAKRFAPHLLFSFSLTSSDLFRIILCNCCLRRSLPYAESCCCSPYQRLSMQAHGKVG